MRYLTRVGVDQSMALPWHQPSAMPKPAPHTVWVHDFAMVAHHDVPCPVCFDRPALWERDLTPGHYREQFRPCGECEAKGWRLHRPRLIGAWLRLRAFRRRNA